MKGTAVRRCLLLLVALVLGAVPVAADEDVTLPPVACTDDGRERFTAAGLDLDMPPPAAAAPELAATADATGRRATPYRTAQFPFVADFAPAASATVKVTLDWADASDFDLSVVDGAGSVLASSLGTNIEDGTSIEQLEVELPHCQVFTILVRNWAGRADQTLALDADVTLGETQLACVDADPAPGCAGKLAGEVPAASPADTRTRLYLGGDPGHTAMVYGYNEQTSAIPFRGTLSPGRPMGGTPNSYTRPVAGFRDQYRNPFVPHFTGTLPAPKDITGTVDALLWLSSPTLKDGGTLYVDLYADGGLVTSVQVPGARIPEAANSPVHVSIPIPEDAPILGATSLTLQLGTTPAVSSGGPGNTGDAIFTIHYGGTQFPSRITLR